MDSQAKKSKEAFDVDAALNEWLDKEAADMGLDPNDPYAGEIEMIQQWQENPTPEGFRQLYNQHQPLIFAANRRYLQSTNLPKEAVKSKAMEGYINALQTFDPGRGAQFKTHLYNGAGRTGRYVQKYSNVGRIPEDRSWLIDTLVNSERSLQDTLGRSPSDTELADEVLLSMNDIAELRDRKVTPKIVATLRKELIKDYLAEAPGGEAAYTADSDLRRQIVFLHGSLSPEQQTVLEHTFEGFGKPVIEDAMDLSKTINMSPQKIRSIRKQIQKKVERYWRAPTK